MLGIFILNNTALVLRVTEATTASADYQAYLTEVQELDADHAAELAKLVEVHIVDELTVA
jgi:hypothetical protein